MDGRIPGTAWIVITCVAACEPRIDFGDVEADTASETSTGTGVTTGIEVGPELPSCPRMPTMTYGAGLAMSGTRYRELVAVQDTANAVSSGQLPDEDELIVILVDGAAVSCDDIRPALPPGDGSRALTIALPPDLDAPGDYALDGEHGGVTPMTAYNGPGPGGTPGGGIYGGALPGTLSIAELDDDAVVGAACYDDVEPFLLSLGFEPSVAFAVERCP